MHWGISVNCMFAACEHTVCLCRGAAQQLLLQQAWQNGKMLAAMCLLAGASSVGQRWAPMMPQGRAVNGYTQKCANVTLSTGQGW
jgi:hypothetical protein